MAQREQASSLHGAGACCENLLSAVEASVAFDPVSISFGAVPSSSGQTHGFDLSLTNLTSTTTTFDLAIGARDSSGTYFLDQSSVPLDAGASTTVTVSMTAQKGASTGFHQAWLTVSSAGNEVAHAAVVTLINRPVLPELSLQKASRRVSCSGPPIFHHS
jgi:minor extracellular serine protease Vpr